MERTKRTETDELNDNLIENTTQIPKLKYKKLGGGSLRLNIGGKIKIIKEGEVFSAYPNEIPPAFKDTIMPLDATQAAIVAQAVKPKPSKVEYKIVPRGKSKSLFDVVDGLDKRINDQPLSKEVAEQLLEDLGK